LTDARPARPETDAVVGSAMVGLASVAFGLIPLFARSLTESGIAPPAVSMYRYLLPALVFLPFLRLRRAEGWATLWGYVSGLIVGLGWVGYVEALTMMPVPVAGVLYMTYPLFILIVGWAFFGSRPGMRAWIGAAVILLAAILVAPLSGTAGFGHAAVLLALAAPAGFGFGVNVLTHKLVALKPLSRISAFSLGSVTGLMPLVLTQPATSVLPSDIGEIGLILGLSFVTALLPQILYTTWVPRIGAAKAGALGAIELPTMFAVGWWVMGDAVGPREAVAGLMVLAAILMTPSTGGRPSVRAPDDALQSGTSDRRTG
jgi:drug/metabolite transporter (DMT)-like permease